MDLLGAKRRMLKQAFTQVGKVSVRVSRWGHTLVHLHHMHVLPRDLFLCEGPQHLPRGVAAANRDNETAARLHCRASLRSDDLGSLSGDRIGIREYLNFHEIPTSTTVS